MKICGDVNTLSNKDNLLKVCNLLGVYSKTCDDMPNNGWNIADMEA